MATLEPNSDELVKMVFSAPIHLCPVLYPNKKEEQDVEEEVHHHHHEHTKLEEHHNHHLTESIEEVAEEEHCHHEKEHEHIHEEHHHHDEIHRSQSPLSNCTSVSEPSVYPEHEHHHHHEEYEHVEHNVHEHIVHITRYEEHVSEEHCYEEPEPLPGYIDEELHRENVGEPDVPEPDHEPEIVCHEHDIEAIDENFSRPADGFMLEVEHQSVVSTDDDDEGESHMSYNVHDHHSVSEEVVPAKSEEHDRVIQELKAQQNQVAPDVDGYKVTCWHDTDSCLEEGDDGEDERVVAVRHVQYHFDSNLVSKFTHSKKHHDSFQTALHAALRQRNPLDNENNVHENVETEEDYEHPEYVEHEEKAESVKDHPVVNPRTFVHHVKDVTEKVEEQLHYEEPHHEDDRNTEAEPFEYHHHHHHHEEEHHYHHESEPVGLIRAARTISTRSEDIPLNEDAQREVSEAPGVRSLLNRFESGNVVHDEETFVNDSRRSSLQTSVYEGRAREILQEVLGLSDDDSQVNDFLHHNQSPSIHKIEQESLPSAASSRRSSVNTQQSSAKAPSSQKPAYTPPERGVTTPRSAKFNPEKFQSVRVVKSVRNQVRIWGGQELKPRHYSRRVSHVTNIGTLFEEPSKQVEEERVVLSEKRDSVFSSVSQPSKHSHRAPSTVGQASKRSSVSSVVSNGSTLVSQSASRRTSVASSATLTNTEVKKVVEQKYEYKPPVPKTEPSSVSSTISYRHNAAAKVPISQRKSVFESEVTPAPKRNFVVVRKVAASETSDEHSSSTTKKSESSIGDWKKQGGYTIAKYIGNRMALYKKGKDAKFADTVGEDDVFEPSPDLCDTNGNLPIHTCVFSMNGASCSSINHKIVPVDRDGIPGRFDEYGFRCENSEPFSSDETPKTQSESSQNRLRWIAHLEFAHDDIEGELTWDKIDISKITNCKLNDMVKAEGIPHSMRPFLWPRLIGATKKRQNAVFQYSKAVAQADTDKPCIGIQIEKDLLRTIPNNICFSNEQSPGIEALRRVLKAVAYLYPDLGYCQGMGVIVASLLLVCSEENTFWIMCALIEDILPSNYYSHSLLGLQADDRVARHLLRVHIPDIDQKLTENDVELSLISVNWLLTLLASAFPMPVLLRVWDMLFVFGGVTIFRVILSMLKLHEQDVLDVSTADGASAELFNVLAQIPSQVERVDHLVEMMTTFEFSITEDLISQLRKKYQAVLMADRGAIINTNIPTNLPKQRLNRRKLTRSKSIIQQILPSREESEENDPKLKNVRQTEHLVDLKNAVYQICQYFISCDENLAKTVVTQANYTLDQEENDRHVFVNAQKSGFKRARALLDFQRQEEDELGFRKNDIILVIDEKDEHCWVGEVNGLRGWFPAKFVEIVDDRGKKYSVYGDEAINSEVTELIRGQLAITFKQILEHGLRHSMYSFALHPWLFIEEIAKSSVQCHFSAVNSRLTLCDTFKLDQDRKILTPEELLYRAVQEINESHSGSKALMDVKVRSLVVYAVNEQCLHLWLELMCKNPMQDVIRKQYYHSDSFIRSPAWMQIKCELRLLTQFSFSLDVDYEISSTEKAKKKCANGQRRFMLSLGGSRDGNTKRSGPISKQPLKEGVRDMLIKHHLFSWDL